MKHICLNCWNRGGFGRKRAQGRFAYQIVLISVKNINRRGQTPLRLWILSWPPPPQNLRLCIKKRMYPGTIHGRFVMECYRDTVVVRRDPGVDLSEKIVLHESVCENEREKKKRNRRAPEIGNAMFSYIKYYNHNKYTETNLNVNYYYFTESLWRAIPFSSRQDDYRRLNRRV